MTDLNLSKLSGEGSLELDFAVSRDLEPGHYRDVCRFREALGEAFDIDGPRTLVIQDHIDAVNPDLEMPFNDQVSRSVQDATERHGGKLWLSHDFGRLAYSGLSKFKVIRSARAETSAHQVFFGALMEDTKHPECLPIAVKPCTTKPEKARSDWLNAVLASRAGERTYKPIGYLIGEGVGYSLTELEGSSDTLDNSSWQNVLLMEDDERYIGQRENIKKVASKLAELHKRNIFHGDPQFKNVAVDITGEIFFIDWESAVIHAPYFSVQQDENTRARVTHKTIHDLKVLFGSMARSVSDGGVSLMDRFTEATQWSFFRKYVFDPYMSTYIKDKNENSPEYKILEDVENDLEKYIKSGELYNSLKRTRHN